MPNLNKRCANGEPAKRRNAFSEGWCGRWHSWPPGESGQSLLEMAILTPILALLVLGVIEIGRYAELSIVVVNAARAGAQYGAQNLATAADSAGITNAAENDAQNIQGLTVNPPANSYGGNTFVLCGCSTDTSASGATCPPTSCNSPAHEVVYVQVNTQGIFTSLFHYPGIPSSITLNGSSQMRVAQ